MRLRITHTFALLLTIAAVSVAQAVAQAPDQTAGQTAPTSDKPLRAELALDYSYLRSNAPPGGCGCFNLNGGSATFAWPVKPGSFALAGDVTVAHAGAISADRHLPSAFNVFAVECIQPYLKVDLRSLVSRRARSTGFHR